MLFRQPEQRITIVQKLGEGLVSYDIFKEVCREKAQEEGGVLAFSSENFSHIFPYPNPLVKDAFNQLLHMRALMVRITEDEPHTWGNHLLAITQRSVELFKEVLSRFDEVENSLALVLGEGLCFRQFSWEWGHGENSLPEILDVLREEVQKDFRLISRFNNDIFTNGVGEVPPLRDMYVAIESIKVVDALAKVLTPPQKASEDIKELPLPGLGCGPSVLYLDETISSLLSHLMDDLGVEYEVVGA